MYDLIGHIFQRESRQKPRRGCIMRENIYQLIKAYRAHLDSVRRRPIPWINDINKRSVFYPWKLMVILNARINHAPRPGELRG